MSLTYSEERRQRIASNARKLEELKVKEALEEVINIRAAESRRTKTLPKESEGTPEPLRRSTRQKHVRAPSPEPVRLTIEEVRERQQAKRLKQQEQQQANTLKWAQGGAGDGEETELDPSVIQHNLNRLSTMSNDQLKTRIKRIRNIPKMKNFVELLYDSGKTELAELAEVHLYNLTQGIV